MFSFLELQDLKPPYQTHTTNLPPPKTNNQNQNNQTQSKPRKRHTNIATEVSNVSHLLRPRARILISTPLSWFQRRAGLPRPFRPFPRTRCRPLVRISSGLGFARGRYPREEGRGKHVGETTEHDAEALLPRGCYRLRFIALTKIILPEV